MRYVRRLLCLAMLTIIIYLSIWVRLATIATPTVLDYDPWWFYRHAKEILENGLRVPAWDALSFSMPGRPHSAYKGWPYTMIAFYKLLRLLDPTITFERAAILSPLLMVALIPVVAFLLGRTLSNELGGLATALFATLTPAFIGVSMAGYCDSDAPVVFHIFLTTWLFLLALGKSEFRLSVPVPTLASIPYLGLAIASALVFIWNWGGGWLTLIIFSAFLLALPIFRLLEGMIHRRELVVELKPLLPELKRLFLPIALIVLATNAIGYALNFGIQLQSLLGGLAFTAILGQPLIVNVSVAELQPINIFTRDGFLAVAGRVGLLPLLLTMFGLPLLAIYKLFKRERIHYVEVFLFLWALSMFVLISRGVRFALLFSCAAAASTGYVIGELGKRLRRDVVAATVWGVLALLTLMFVSDALQLGQAAGMLISQNWYEALDWLKANADGDAMVATWWDPGHIIAGYTGLRVHADGAHCGPGECIPYDHNVRIQDMGRIFSTSSEEEALSILRKYVQLTEEQIAEVKAKYGDRVPQHAFKPVSELYLIASNDLIGKYYWMSYFGTGVGRNFVQLPFSHRDARGNLVYGGIVTLRVQNDTFVPILNLPQQGIRNAVIREVVHYMQGFEQRYEITGVENSVDGLLWIDPTLRLVIFMEPAIRDSTFTKLFFFDGRELDAFELVFSNPEVKIFRVSL